MMAASTNPRLPADHGLPALALLMQLQAGGAMIYGVFVTLALLSSSPSRLPIPAGEVLAVLGLLGVGLARGLMHLRAARAAAARSPGAPAAVRAYVISALLATGASIGLLLTVGDGLPLTLALGLAALGLFWPVTVGVLVGWRPSIRAALAVADGFEVELAPADRSIEGAGVLMVSLGGIGLALALYATALLLLSGAARGLGIVFLVVTAALVVRSAMHLWAGLRAVSGQRPEGFQRAVGHYNGWALASVGAVALAVLLVSGGHDPLGALTAMLVSGVALMLWPLLLQRFARRTLLAELADVGDTIPWGPAPDRGLTALGYLLLFSGGAQAAVWVARLLIGAPSGWLLPGAGDALFSALEGPELWLSPLVAAVTLWAGRELVTMSARYRLAAALFAALDIGASALTWALSPPWLGDLWEIVEAPTVMVSVIISLILPILALALVRRRLPASA